MIKGKLFRAAIFAAGTVLLIWFALPMTFGVSNIGNRVGIGLSLVLMLLALFWQYFRKGISFLWRFFIGKVALVLVGGFVTLCIGTGLVISAQMVFAAVNAPPKTDIPKVVVVLGCEVKGRTPGQMLKRRLDVAFEFLEENESAVCILSGGQGEGEEIPEAAAMRDYLFNKGINADRLFLESSSTNTEENIRFSKAVIEKQGMESLSLGNDSDIAVVIATDGFHQLRAAKWCEREGLTPYALSAFTRLDILPAFYMRELFGMVEFYVRGGN